MVYIQSWHEFQDAAEALYEQYPEKTRYCVKWKSSEGKLVLKITNDITCLKFKTYSSIFLNRFEALNLALLEKMQNRQKPVVAVEATPSAPAASTAASSQATVPSGESAASSTTIQSSGPKTGGVKKKKGKKK